MTVYAVTAEPPVDAGAAHVNETWESPTVPVSPVGAPGTVSGRSNPVWSDASLIPRAFVAVTENL